MSLRPVATYRIKCLWCGKRFRLCNAEMSDSGIVYCPHCGRPAFFFRR